MGFLFFILFSSLYSLLVYCPWIHAFKNPCFVEKGEMKYMYTKCTLFACMWMKSLWKYTCKLSIVIAHLTMCILELQTSDTPTPSQTPLKLGIKNKVRTIGWTFMGCGVEDGSGWIPSSCCFRVWLLTSKAMGVLWSRRWQLDTLFLVAATRQLRW